MANGRDAGVEIKGLRDFRRDLKRLEPEVEKELKADFREISRTILGLALAGTPRDSGDLARSLRTFVTARGAGIRSRLDYANVVHWGGTIQPRGTPIVFERTEFLTRPLQQEEDRVMNDAEQAIDRAARKTGWH